MQNFDHTIILLLISVLFTMYLLLGNKYLYSLLLSDISSLELRFSTIKIRYTLAYIINNNIKNSNDIAMSTPRWFNDACESVPDKTDIHLITNRFKYKTNFKPVYWKFLLLSLIWPILLLRHLYMSSTSDGSNIIFFSNKTLYNVILFINSSELETLKVDILNRIIKPGHTYISTYLEDIHYTGYMFGLLKQYINSNNNQTSKLLTSILLTFNNKKFMNS